MSQDCQNFTFYKNRNASSRCYNQISHWWNLVFNRLVVGPEIKINWRMENPVRIIDIDDSEQESSCIPLSVLCCWCLTLFGYVCLIVWFVATTRRYTWTAVSRWFDLSDPLKPLLVIFSGSDHSWSFLSSHDVNALCILVCSHHL